MFFTDIFPYLNCLNLCGTNVTQSIRPMSYVYHARLIIPRLHNAREIWKRRFHSEHTSNVFPSTATAEKFEKATITGHFGFVFEENPCRESTWLSCSHPFEKLCFERFIFKRTNVFHWFFPHISIVLTYL